MQEKRTFSLQYRGQPYAPGRELINEIEQTLYDLDADDWELSGKLEDYILEHGDHFLGEWRDIKHNHSEKNQGSVEFNA